LISAAMGNGRGQHLGGPLPVGVHLIGGQDQDHPLRPPVDCIEMAVATMPWPALGTWDSRLRRTGTLLEAAQKLTTKAIGLAVAKGNAEHLTVAEGIAADPHHHRPRSDPLKALDLKSEIDISIYE
jgi:hypothetical protein